MKEFMYIVPEESIDCVFEDVTSLRFVENQLRECFVSKQYQEVLLPSLEYTDLYMSLDPNLKTSEIFQFINHEGRSIAMRYDFTVPLARLYATTQKENEGRYCYFGKVYRKVKRHKGRSSEIYQGGVELINCPGIQGDIQCLNLMQQTIPMLGLDKVIVEVGYAPFFHRLIEIVGHPETLTKILKYRDISGMKQFVATLDIDVTMQQLLLALPMSFGSLDEIKDKILATKDMVLIECLHYLIKINESMSSTSTIIFDLGMVPSMHYYTGIMIKGYASESVDCIVNGGRYDHLLERFDLPVGAVGFCYNISQIIQSMQKGVQNND